MSTAERARLRWAMIASGALHVGAVAALWIAAGTGEALPKMRVYGVDIVSPPPQLAGEFNPGGGGEPSLGPEAPPAEAEPAPVEPETPAPAPAPEPEAPPPPKPVETPAPKPEPKAPAKAEPKPTPAKPAEKPAPAKPRETPARVAQAEKPPAKAPAKPAAKPAEKPAGGGEGGGSGASRGANPDASSSGGEGLDVHLRGMQCPSPDYCANIIRQLYRYFRPPSGATADQAEVFFVINRDGTVSDMRVVRSAGSFQFRVAAMEAVEQAGLNKAFGPLPRSFSVDRLPVSFFFRPAR